MIMMMMMKIQFVNFLNQCDNKGEDLLKDQTVDSRHVKYPLYSDSLVTTLRFEKINLI